MTLGWSIFLDYIVYVPIDSMDCIFKLTDFRNFHFNNYRSNMYHTFMVAQFLNGSPYNYQLLASFLVEIHPVHDYVIQAQVISLSLLSTWCICAWPFVTCSYSAQVWILVHFHIELSCLYIFKQKFFFYVSTFKFHTLNQNHNKKACTNE